jgi:hypothetical protein
MTKSSLDWIKAQFAPAGVLSFFVVGASLMHVPRRRKPDRCSARDCAAPR